MTHQGKDTIWDFSKHSANTIQWAAFYSDCEHEVMPVTSGHRITLTYNLYLRDRLGGVVGQPSAIEVNQYPFYDVMMEALKSPNFMPEGCTLGFYCEHAYAHSNDRLRKQLPHALKGADAIFYTVCRHVGIDVKVKPVMADVDDEYYEEDDDDEKDRKKEQKEDHQDFLDSEIVGTDLHDLKLIPDGESHDCITDKQVSQSAPLICERD